GPAGRGPVDPGQGGAVGSEPAADEGREGRVPTEGDRPYHHRMHVDASPFRADVAKEVREIRIDLIERAGKSRHHLPAAQERNLRYALELDGAIEREVLVPVHAA